MLFRAPAPMMGQQGHVETLMDMVRIYRPKSNSEALVVASLMRAHGIVHFMQGGAFSSMMPGPLSTSLNAQTLMVEASQADLARELLADFMDEDEARAMP